MYFSRNVFAVLFSALLASNTVATQEDVDNSSSSLRRRTFIMPPEPKQEEGTRRVFVQYRPDSREVMHKEVIKRSSKMKMLYDFDDMDTMVMTIPEEDIEKFKKDPRILSIQDDVKRFPQHLPDSIQPRKLQSGEEVVPYGIDLVKAREAWAEFGKYGEDVSVCIIDTGVDEFHEDLPKQNGVDFPGLEWGKDGVGHGTHCAGTVAAAENGKGVVGVAPQANIFSVKVFSDDGAFAYSSGILGAARVCAENGASIISMSLGGPLPNLFEVLGYRSLMKEFDIISVAAAGNSGNGFWSFPASYPDVLSVAALDSNKERAFFSQYNRQVDIAAPGVDVLSTFPMSGSCQICDRAGYEYGVISGTSMATPHVAGVLALLKSIKPNATPEELIQAIQSTAEDLGTQGKDREYGYGLIDALNAARQLVET